MPTNYPVSLDDGTSLPNPAATDKTNSPSLSGQQSSQNDALKAIEAKVGIGVSTPVANRLLFGNGTGTSAWTAITSANLAATLTDETGTGSVVFATTPTLVTPKVDTINESTPANGVTIDGLNIKSGALVTSNSVVTANLTADVVTAAKLADSSVFPANLTAGSSGSTWAWQTWAPTWANFTVGNGTVTAKYIQSGKTVTIYLKFVAGTTSAFGTNPTFTVPVTAANQYGANNNTVGIGYAEDAGVAGYSFGYQFNASTTVVSIYTLNAAGTILNFSASITATSPWTLGTGDFFSTTFTYEAA